MYQKIHHDQSWFEDQANDWGHDVILCNHYLHNLALVPSYFVKNIGSSRKFVWIIYGDKGTAIHTNNEYEVFKSWFLCHYVVPMVTQKDFLFSFGVFWKI